MRVKVLCLAVCKFSVYALILSIRSTPNKIDRTVEFPILSLTACPRIFRVSCMFACRFPWPRSRLKPFNSSLFAVRKISSAVHFIRSQFSSSFDFYTRVNYRNSTRSAHAVSIHITRILHAWTCCNPSGRFCTLLFVVIVYVTPNFLFGFQQSLLRSAFPR